jgi:ABC-type transporter MlaC component
VIDVLIQGISMAGSFRAQFTAIMKDGGFERLMQLLREKNAANEAASGEGAAKASQ